MEVVESLQKIGYTVNGLFEEPGFNSYRMTIKEPHGSYSAISIVNEIQKQGYNVTKFDVRFLHIAVSFQLGPITPSFLFLAKQLALRTTNYRPEEDIAFLKLDCYCIENLTDGKTETE